MIHMGHVWVRVSVRVRHVHQSDVLIQPKSNATRRHLSLTCRRIRVPVGSAWDVATTDLNRQTSIKANLRGRCFTSLRRTLACSTAAQMTSSTSLISNRRQSRFEIKNIYLFSYCKRRCCETTNRLFSFFLFLVTVWCQILRQWHAAYPVTNAEREMNEIVYSQIQGPCSQIQCRFFADECLEMQSCTNPNP